MPTRCPSAFHRAAWDHLGLLVEERRALDWHRQRVLELVDVVRIRSRGLVAFLDANGRALDPSLMLVDVLSSRPPLREGDCP